MGCRSLLPSWVPNPPWEADDSTSSLGGLTESGSLLVLLHHHCWLNFLSSVRSGASEVVKCPALADFKGSEVPQHLSGPGPSSVVQHAGTEGSWLGLPYFMAVGAGLHPSPIRVQVHLGQAP